MTQIGCLLDTGISVRAIKKVLGFFARANFCFMRVKILVSQKSELSISADCVVNVGTLDIQTSWGTL